MSGRELGCLLLPYIGTEILDALFSLPNTPSRIQKKTPAVSAHMSFDDQSGVANRKNDPWLLADVENPTECLVDQHGPRRIGQGTFTRNLEDCGAASEDGNNAEAMRVPSL